MMKSLKLLTTMVIVTAGPLSGSADDSVRYNRDVLPLLADHCFSCHGFDSAKREAGLRLDQRVGSTEKLESGARAIVPGDLKNSELWTRVTSDDPDTHMPPPETGHTLTSGQREMLRRWIEQGAEYEQHWAYIPPQQVQAPIVAGVEQPIDRFIRATTGDGRDFTVSSRGSGDTDSASHTGSDRAAAVAAGSRCVRE